MSTNPSQPNNHIDEMAGLQYLEGQLERSRALELSAHTERCNECRALLSVLERESRLLTRAMREEEEPVPARLLAPIRERMPWAWIISFGMAAAGSYWLWTTVIEPWQAQLNEAGFGGTNLVTMLFFQGALWKGWSSMWTLVQALAVISMCAVGYLVLRRGLRRMSTIAVVMGTVLAALFLPSVAGAAEIHKNETSYTLPSSATVNDDLIVLGNNIRIDGTVNGDLIAFGANITVNGHVTGDVLSGGTNLQIYGTVDGNVRYGGNMLNLHGKIGRNLTVGSGSIVTDSNSEIGWGVTIGSGDVTLDGKIGRDILGVVGRMHLGGIVGGNISLEASQSFDVGSSAQVKGKIKYEGPKQPEIESGAQLASAPEVTIKQRDVDFYSAFSWWHKALAWGAAFVFGLVFMLLVPGFFNDGVNSANRFGASIGIGVLLFVGIPFAAILACITIVGLSVGISTMLLFLIFAYGSKVFVATWIGRMVLGKSGYAGFYASTGKATWRTPEAVGQMALGLLVIYGLRMVPYAGFWVAVGAEIWGVGALGLTIYKKIANRNVAEAPAAA